MVLQPAAAEGLARCLPLLQLQQAFRPLLPPLLLVWVWLPPLIPLLHLLHVRGWAQRLSQPEAQQTPQQTLTALGLLLLVLLVLLLLLLLVVMLLQLQQHLSPNLSLHLTLNPSSHLHDLLPASLESSALMHHMTSMLLLLVPPVVQVLALALQQVGADARGAAAVQPSACACVLLWCL
jgi:hypothetical protein